MRHCVEMGYTIQSFNNAGTILLKPLWKKKTQMTKFVFDRKNLGKRENLIITSIPSFPNNVLKKLSLTLDQTTKF